MFNKILNPWRTKKAMFISVLFLSAVFAACNTNSPTRQDLIGIWSEPYHVNDMVKAITFKENGTLIYTDKPDTTWSIVPTYGGTYAELYYTITEEDKIRFSGETIKFSIDSPYIDTVSFAFTSAYKIKGRTLTIDSFAYDGGISTSFYRPLKLKKK